VGAEEVITTPGSVVNGEVPMAQVLCEVSEGLRPAEVAVTIRDVQGKLQFLRIDRDFIVSAGGRSYLPVGVVHDDRTKGIVLIELPYEADSGANGLWVPQGHVRLPTRAPA
jgi:hypothetical protein